MDSENKEHHHSDRIGWLRAAVLGANDGILSTSSIVLGVAAAHVTHRNLLVAGMASLVAGAMSMAAGEYVSVHSQADTEKAELALERRELKADSKGEHKELAAIYVGRGLKPALGKQVSAALDSLRQQDRIREIPNAEERVRTIAQAYAASPENTLIVSPDNASRRALNVAVREELKAKGTLAPDDQPFRVLVPRQDMTGAERTWASRYETGDTVRYSRGSKAVGIEAGSYGTVVGMNSADNLLTVKTATGELATYDPRRLSGVSVYREISREFSTGDRIQFTAPDKTLNVANRDLAVIDAIAPDGRGNTRIKVRLDSGRTVEFDPTEHRHFDHGYAVTSHSSQGLTAERVLVNADTGVHPDLVNSRFGYVSVSRASHDATVFTDNFAKLAPQLSADISKTSALKIAPAASVGQGIGLGITR
jgi:VIT1/CCC1 family predicted Fe2+/Mn2+ transporter